MKTTKLLFIGCTIQVLLFFSGCASKQNNNHSDPDFRHVCENRFIVLTDSAALNLQNGNPELASSTEGYAAAITDINLDKTPAKYKALIGQEFDIYDGHSQKSTVKIKSLKLMVRYIPHFGQVSNWSGEYSGTKMPAKEIANEIWNTGSPVIVAEFEAKSAKNMDFKFAVPHNTADISQFNPQKNNQTSVQEIEKFLDSRNTWWIKSIGQQDIQTFKINDELCYYTVSRTIGDNCGGEAEFKTSYFVIKAENNKLSLVTEIKEQLNTVAVIDINDDQKMEFLVSTWFGENYLLRETKGKWILDKQYLVAYLDCPC